MSIHTYIWIDIFKDPDLPYTSPDTFLVSAALQKNIRRVGWGWMNDENDTSYSVEALSHLVKDKQNMSNCSKK